MSDVRPFIPQGCNQQGRLQPTIPERESEPGAEWPQEADDGVGVMAWLFGALAICGAAFGAAWLLAEVARAMP